MIELTFDKSQWDKLSKKLRALSPVARDSITRKAFTDLTLETEGQLKQSLSGAILRVRSGRLRSSIGSIVIGQGKDLVGMVGSGIRQGGRVSYANIHETGGTITPKNSKYLAIPLSAALTPAGVLKKKPREYNNTFVMKSKNGNLIIAQKRGSRMSRIVALFVLKKKVEIPARHYMSRTAEEVSPRALEIMNRSIERGLAKA